MFAQVNRTGILERKTKKYKQTKKIKQNTAFFEKFKKVHYGK